MKFNEKLTRLRKTAGLSQEELGNRLDVARQTVSKWELGETTPEMEKLVELSNLFNVSLDEMAKETELPAVIAREIDHKKIDSVYRDVGRAKTVIKWYVIVFGTVAIMILIVLINFFVRSIFKLW